MSSRVAQALSLLLAGVAFAAEAPPVHPDAGSVVPAQERHPANPRPPTPHGKLVQLSLPGGKTARAYVARPKGSPRGGLLMLHEWWGLNDWVKGDADRYATQGYLVLAVDLFDGVVTADAEEAQKLMSDLDEKHAQEVEVAGVDWLVRALPGKKIATLGWSMGGAQSLKASLASEGRVSATVMFYGLPVTDVNLLKKLRGPVLGIWAKKDDWVTPEKVAAFDLALSDAGIKHEFRSYDADHAFANPSGGRFNAPAAQDANDAARRFLKSVLH